MLKQVFQQPNAHSFILLIFQICQIEKEPLLLKRYHPFVLSKDIIIILISTSRFEIKRKNQPNDTIPRYGDEINHTKNEICVKNGII